MNEVKIKNDVKKHIDSLTVNQLNELIDQAYNNKRKFLAWSDWSIITYAENRKNLLSN